ncbi:hypothetical protein SISNIDRAFT_491287 [Sistotremastrum niveocremeum HHB9708]|uniref:Uncharacterized protein n=1 Tax=Sistotremastrum niveocremeum HHB9708 TaxID=1314777 RepID=A0A164MXK1_9AGAM|nr:hypothetical protein SISNIDRAFT_491287 [Sistotremastrum niveocremeum HHB9708]
MLVRPSLASKALHKRNARRSAKSHIYPPSFRVRLHAVSRRKFRAPSLQIKLASSPNERSESPHSLQPAKETLTFRLAGLRAPGVLTIRPASGATADPQLSQRVHIDGNGKFAFEYEYENHAEVTAIVMKSGQIVRKALKSVAIPVATLGFLCVVVTLFCYFTSHCDIPLQRWVNVSAIKRVMEVAKEYVITINNTRLRIIALYEIAQCYLRTN